MECVGGELGDPAQHYPGLRVRGLDRLVGHLEELHEPLGRVLPAPVPLVLHLPVLDPLPQAARVARAVSVVGLHHRGQEPAVGGQVGGHPEVGESAHGRALASGPRVQGVDARLRRPRVERHEARQDLEAGLGELVEAGHPALEAEDAERALPRLDLLPRHHLARPAAANLAGTGEVAGDDVQAERGPREGVRLPRLAQPGRGPLPGGALGLQPVAGRAEGGDERRADHAEPLGGIPSDGGHCTPLTFAERQGPRASDDSPRSAEGSNARSPGDHRRRCGGVA